MKHLLLFIIILLNTMLLQGKVYRVLFIGNSYTAYNDLPNTFAQLCTSQGDSVFVNSNLIGSASFNVQSTNAATLALLQQGNWDFVVLQGQSQEPSFSPGQVQAQTYPYAKTLDSLAKAFSPCAEVFYYMTWGRKNGDASNCANYPPICTYAGMQQRLRESYQEMALNNGSNTAPVGIVWQRVRKTDSTIILYNADESHPSVQGTYVAACTFYQSFFHKKFKQTAFISAGVSAAEAATIQTACNKIVLDSLYTWQQFGTMPIANFTTSINNKIITITNSSAHQSSTNYAFGDGQTITNNATNLLHTYANNGTYTIVQTIENACGKIDTAAATITINSALQTTDFYKASIQVFRKNNAILFENLPNNCTVKLYSLNGQLLYNQQVNQNKVQITIPEHTTSLLLYKIITANNCIITGKL